MIMKSTATTLWSPREFTWMIWGKLARIKLQPRQNKANRAHNSWNVLCLEICIYAKSITDAV